MAFQSMIDMARTPAEVKTEVAKMVDMPAPAMAKPSVPTYPYGLCISMDEECLKKLGLDGDLPEVGEMIHLAAMGKVTSVSENEREGTDGSKERCCRVEIQITHLATENEDDEADREMATQQRRKRFYGGDEGEAEAA